MSIIEYPIKKLYVCVCVLGICYCPVIQVRCAGRFRLDLCVVLVVAEPSFLGFRKKPSGKLDTCAPGLGVRLDWPDLNDLCNSSQIHLSWRDAQNHKVVVSDALITDNNISVQAVLNIDENTTQVLNPQCCRCDIIEYHQTCQRQCWMHLRLQRKLACLPCANHTMSHSIL